MPQQRRPARAQIEHVLLSLCKLVGRLRSAMEDDRCRNHLEGCERGKARQRAMLGPMRGGVARAIGVVTGHVLAVVDDGATVGFDRAAING